MGSRDSRRTVVIVNLGQSWTLNGCKERLGNSLSFNPLRGELFFRSLSSDRTFSQLEKGVLRLEGQVRARDTSHRRLAVPLLKR